MHRLNHVKLKPGLRASNAIYTENESASRADTGHVTLYSSKTVRKWFHNIGVLKKQILISIQKLKHCQLCKSRTADCKDSSDVIGLFDSRRSATQSFPSLATLTNLLRRDTTCTDFLRGRFGDWFRLASGRYIVTNDRLISLNRCIQVAVVVVVDINYVVLS